jgi:serine/threonine-protein kinase HipA
MKVLTVYYHGGPAAALKLGRLAYYQGKMQFEYSDEALQAGIQLSPFHLPLQNGLIEAGREPFTGLHGLFNDSLPDGWGLYLMDKVFKQHGVDLSGITPIDRLAFIGGRAMGALSYQPDEGAQYFNTEQALVDIDRLAEESVQMYTGELEQVVDEMADVGSPSGGARPKAVLAVNGDQATSGTHAAPEGYQHWLIKFPAGKTPDKRCEGSIEYLYSVMARNAGIDFPESRLIPGREDNHYFMVKRFDRGEHNCRHHIHTLAGLLNLDFRVASVGYDALLKACSSLTRSHKETTQLFRRMVFNVMSGNRDDHSKNFSFMLDKEGRWVNSPAYDVVYNYGLNGEHTLDINAKGKNVQLSDINELAERFSIDQKSVKRIIGDVSDSLSAWGEEAQHYSIPKPLITEISKYINRQRQSLQSVSAGGR